ncbi:hypothetical protein BGX27_008405 [Mortierella sp. AM989]|nr:hypothetical protein BGX27_008405 [Mortierella sp. AM989]
MNGTTGSSNLNGRLQPSNNPILVLEPVNDTFALKSLDLPEQTKVKIGRQTGVTTAPHPSNGYFDSKVLSRVHAEVWSEGGKVYIRDLKSSNGTFLNGRRLCPESTESEPFELNQNDSLEFGIDIMDENGALLHEKVSCKIYISRMSYPTPGSSPQDSHAKIKPSSPVTSGVNSIKSNSVTVQGGQSENIDLIISRLQNELTRSQETYADLGFLKHSLGELEKVMIVNGSEANNKNDDFINVNGQTATATNLSISSPSVNYLELLNQRDKEHAAEISKLTNNFEKAKAHWEIQRAQELKSFQEENEMLRRNQEKANEALNQAASKMDFIMSRINNMTREHKQELEIVQKKHEVAIATLEAKHKDDINRIVIDADAEQEGLILKHKQELADAVARAGVGRSEDSGTLGAELALLKKEAQILRESGDLQSRNVKALTKENSELLQQLDDIKAELRSVQQTMKNNLGNLSSLSPAMHVTGSEDSLISRGITKSEESVTSTGIAHVSSEGNSKPAFSWSQFVFPIAKRNNAGQTQPSTLLLSGGFMLVGLGV